MSGRVTFLALRPTFGSIEIIYLMCRLCWVSSTERRRPACCAGSAGKSNCSYEQKISTHCMALWILYCENMPGWILSTRWNQR